MTRYILAAVLLSGCAAVGVEAGGQSIEYVIGETTHEVAHACDCDSTKGPWAACENDGALCCRECGKVCYRFASIPVTPPCPSVADHLKNCGGAKVCPACHHPCP